MPVFRKYAKRRPRPRAKRPLVRKYRKPAQKFATKVKKVIYKESETKHWTTSISLANMDQTLNSTLANQHPIHFNPSQGTTSDRRIGNEVFLIGTRVEGVFTSRSEQSYPYLMKMLFYQLKGVNNMEIAPTAAQLAKIVQNGSSSEALGPGLLSLLKPLNTDLFKFFHVRTVKIGKANYAAGADPNNDFSFSHHFKLWIPHRKKVVFDDADNVPKNYAMYFGGANVRVDGATGTDTNTVIYSMDFTHYFKDI